VVKLISESGNDICNVWVVIQNTNEWNRWYT